VLEILVGFDGNGHGRRLPLTGPGREAAF
jgi:hypothetical protein